MKNTITACLLLLTLGLTSAYGQSARTRTTENTKKTSARPEPSPTPQQPENAANPPALDDTPGEEPLKIMTDLVSLPVSVMDRQGRFVLDLTQNDFQIFEDGKQQEVAFFDTTEKPFTVALMIDVSRSTRFKI